jgi:hypothetical protein
VNWVGHILRKMCHLQQVIKGKITGGIEVTGRWGRRCRELLDDINERKRQKFWGFICIFVEHCQTAKHEIRTAALWHLSIIQHCDDHGKDCSQTNYRSEVKMYLEIQFNHTFRYMEAFKTSLFCYTISNEYRPPNVTRWCSCFQTKLVYIKME